MANPHSLLQSLLPDIQRNPQLLGILAQSLGGMGGAGGPVGGILGPQASMAPGPQAPVQRPEIGMGGGFGAQGLAGGPPQGASGIDASMGFPAMPQSRPTAMTAAAPRVGQSGPRASGWRDTARLLAAGLGTLRGGNDLDVLRADWEKRDLTTVASQRAAEDRARLQSAIAGLTPQQQAAAMADPEAFAKAVLNPTVVGESVYGLSGFKTPPMSAAQMAAATKPVPTEGGAYVRRVGTNGALTDSVFQGAPQIVNADPTHNILEVTPGGGALGAGPSLGERNNNPGNLEDGEFARSQPGYVGTDGRFARFATPEAGAAAQERLLTNAYIGRGQNTIQSIIEGVPGEGGRRVHGYSPRQSDGGDNTDEQVNNYIGYVARRVGIDPTAQVPADKVAAVAAAMREFETGQRLGAQGGGARVVQQGVPKQTGFRPMTDADRQQWGIPPGIPGKVNIETGEPTVISGAAGALPKPPPRLVVQGYSANRAAIDKVNRALELLTATPGSVGLVRGLGETINQRVDPGGVAARAALMDISGQIMSDRSGAAVPAAEMKRLEPYLPQITDTADTAKTKLRGLLRELENTNQLMEYDYPTLGQPGAGEAGGADVADQIANGEVPTAPSAGGGRRNATAGAPRTTKPPVQVRSLQEAESLPKGTVFVLNGRRGVVK